MSEGNDIPAWEMAVEVLDVFKCYPHSAKPALSGLSLTVAKGEFFGLLGKNGAGKTTLVSILSGMIREYQGEVRIAGQNLANGFGAIRRLIGIVPQNVALHEELTPRENLMYFGGLYGLGGKALRDRVAECLRVTNLEDKADRRVCRLSGGMQRLANLAASLVHQPKILFLDEPTLGIDIHSRRSVIEVLKQLNRAGMTLLFTTHYLGEVQDCFTKVAILDEGVLRASGPVAGLLASHPECHDLESLFFALTGGRDVDDGVPVVVAGREQ